MKTLQSALSENAWQLLLEQLSKLSSSNKLPECHYFPDFGLPDAQLVFQHSPGVWVAQYEKNLATLTRKRKKEGMLQTGVFYTPQPITQYLVQQTLGNTLADIRQQIQIAKCQKDSQQHQQLIKQAQSIRVIDPACGTGIFLQEALKVFHLFYTSVSSNAGQADLLLRGCIESQLTGIDLDATSVEITRLRLSHTLRTLQPSLRIQIPSQLWCGDTLNLLQNDPNYPRQWTFILGNPPYMSEVRSQSKNFQSLSNGAYYNAKMDLCDAFLAWGIEHTALNGKLAYVLPEYWTQRSSTKNLRKMILEQGTILEFWRFEKTGIFKEAPGHHTSLLIWNKDIQAQTSPESTRWGQIKTVSDLQPQQLAFAQPWLDPKSGKLLFGKQSFIELMERLAQQPPLLQPKQLQQGIVLPQGRVAPELQKKYGLQIPGVFLLTDEEVDCLHLNEKEKELLKPFFLPTNFQAFQGFSTEKPDYWIIYIDLNARRQFEKAPEQYPQLIQHFQSCTVINTSSFAPYGLHRSRQTHWFETTQKILSPRQVLQPAFATIEQPAYVGEGFYIIQPDQHDCHVLTAIFNSSFAWFWFYQQKRKGHRLQIDKDVLSAFPQAFEDNHSIIENLKHMGNMLQSGSSREQNRDVYRQINNLVYQLYGLSAVEVSFIEETLGTIPGVRLF